MTDDDQPFTGSHRYSELNMPPAAIADWRSRFFGKRDDAVGGENVDQILLYEMLAQSRRPIAIPVLNQMLSLLADWHAFFVELMVTVQPSTCYLYA